MTNGEDDDDDAQAITFRVSRARRLLLNDSGRALSLSLLLLQPIARLRRSTHETCR